MRAEGRTWPVTIVAAWYLLLCTVTCVYYGSLYLRPNGATVPIVTQWLCFGAAVSAGLYFLRAKLGHRLLMALTVLTLVSIGTSDARATAFHAIVLAVLLVPLLAGRRRELRRTLGRAG